MKEYRIFISSTFKDMQQERDVIRNDVFPELEMFAKKYNIAISIIDLRWGINTEECETNNESSFKIFRTCFDEIDESKPFFVGLVGNRYGWIPNLEELPLSLDSKFKDFLKFQGKSITESEMLYAIDTFENDGLFVFAFRNEIKGELSQRDKDIYLSSSKEDKAKIDDLKKRLKNNSIISYFDYDTKISEGVLDLKEFASNLTKLIEEKIATTIKDDEKKNSIDKILEEHDAAIELNHSSFSGRENVFKQLEDFYKSEDKFIAIKGESGTGKSSLIQEEIYRKRKDKNAYTLSFLLGSGEGSKDVRYALSAVLYQAKMLNGHKFNENYFDINKVENNYDSLVNNLSMELTQLARKKRVYLYLDALDQLLDNGRGVLSYLNTRYFALENIDIKIVLTFIPKQTILNELKLKLFKVMEISPLSESDVINITKKRLSREKKSLSNQGIQEIVNKNNNGVMCASSPLYLSLLLQQIVNLDYLDFAKIEELKAVKNDEDAIYEYIETLIKNAPLDLKGEMFNIIDSASSKIGKEFVFYALGIISMSRNGVRESDIRGIFNILGIHYESTDFSYLRKMFRHFLSSHSSYIDFNHKIIDDILEDYYFESNKEESIIVSLKTLDYLDSLDDSDEFKKNEYFYYAYKANSKELFYKRLKETKHLEPFYNLFEQEETSNIVSEFFSELSNIDNEVISKLIKDSHCLNFLGRRRLLLLLLDNPNIDELNRLKALHQLSLDEKVFGNINSADHLSNVMMKEAIKHKMFINESLSLRGEILLSRYKYPPLKKLLKKVKDDADSEIVAHFQKECDLVMKRKKKEEAYWSKETLLEKLENSKPSYIYEHRKVFERNVSKHIKSSDEFISLLLNKEKEYRNEALNSGVKEIVAYSYLLYLSGIIYLAKKDKESAKEVLSRGYHALNSIFELLEEKEDFSLIGDFALYLRRLRKIKHKDLREKQITMTKHGISDISYSETKSRAFTFGSVFAAIFLVIVVADVVINANAFLISYWTEVKADYFILSYISSSLEVLIFIMMFPFIYFLVSFIFADNHYSRRAISDFAIATIFLIIIVVSTILFAYSYDFDTSILYDEMEFYFLNSFVGSLGVTLIAYSLNTFAKKEVSMSERINFKSLRLKSIVRNVILLGVSVAVTVIGSKLYKSVNFDIGANVTTKASRILSNISVIGVNITMGIGLIVYLASLVLELRRVYEK